MNDTPVTLPPEGVRFGWRALAVGLVALAVCVVAALLSQRPQFFRAYLVGYLAALGPALGALAILMVHHVTGGAWGQALRGVLESAARTTPLLALLFVPLLFGLADVYPWASWTAEEIQGSHVLHTKHQYLNVPFFVGRAALYFAVWVGLTFLLTGSVEETPERADWLRRLSGPGLALYGLTVTFAAIDWVMSLEPFWYSTIFGMLFAAGQVLAAFAFGVTALVLLSSAANAAGRLARPDLQDLGSLMLAFVMLWAYMAFSQYMLIWYGNLPEETPYYLRRLGGGWQIPGLLLVVLQFALPFLLLLSRDLKRDARMLTAVALLILLMRVVDVYWTVMPAFVEPGEPFRPHWLDAVALVGVVGVWLAGFVYMQTGRPLFVPRPVEEVAHA